MTTRRIRWTTTPVVALVALVALVASGCGRGAPSAGTTASSATVGAAGASAPPSAGSAGSASALASAAGDELTRALAAIDSASSAAPDPSSRAPRIEKLEATIVAPKVPGATEALAKGRWRLRGCLVAAIGALEADAGADAAAGTFDFDLLFDADGRVATAQPKAKGAPGASAATLALEKCVGEAILKMPFPAPTEEGARGALHVALRGARAK